MRCVAPSLSSTPSLTRPGRREKHNGLNVAYASYMDKMRKARERADTPLERAVLESESNIQPRPQGSLRVMQVWLSLYPRGGRAHTASTVQH